MDHVKVILMLLLKNMFHQKIYIHIVFVVDGEVYHQAFLSKLINNLKLLKK